MIILFAMVCNTMPRLQSMKSCTDTNSQFNADNDTTVNVEMRIHHRV